MSGETTTKNAQVSRPSLCVDRSSWDGSTLHVEPPVDGPTRTSWQAAKSCAGAPLSIPQLAVYRPVRPADPHPWRLPWDPGLISFVPSCGPSCLGFLLRSFVRCLVRFFGFRCSLLHSFFLCSFLFSFVRSLVFVPAVFRSVRSCFVTLVSSLRSARVFARFFLCSSFWFVTSGSF